MTNETDEPDIWLTCPVCKDVALIDRLANGRTQAWCTHCGLKLEGNIDIDSAATLWERMAMHGPQRVLWRMGGKVLLTDRQRLKWKGGELAAEQYARSRAREQAMLSLAQAWNSGEPVGNLLLRVTETETRDDENEWTDYRVSLVAYEK